MADALTAPPENDFQSFLDIVRRLRKECPWDREQTPESMRTAIIEEVYEAVEAIDKRDWRSLAEELGDVLLNVVFQTVLAEESGRFDIHDVLRLESDKLVYRHPHVFGNDTADSAEEVLQHWESRKKAASDRTSVLDGVPPSLPALLYAERAQTKAARVGFDFPQIEQAWDKVKEEVDELQATAADDSDEWSNEFGDVLFALVNVGRLNGISPEMALRLTNEKFLRRFRFIEAELEKQGRSPADASLEEMDRFWEQAKAAEAD